MEFDTSEQTCSFNLADDSDIEETINKLSQTARHMKGWSLIE